MVSKKGGTTPYHFPNILNLNLNLNFPIPKKKKCNRKERKGRKETKPNTYIGNIRA